MKKAISYVTILLVTLFMYSCSKTPSEKLVGVWEGGDLDGLILSIHNNGSWSMSGGENGSWTLNDREPLILKLYDEKGDLDEELNFTFINENTFELSEGSFKQLYFRKQ